MFFRDIIMRKSAFALGIAMLCAASASADGSHIKGVTAIGEVFGDGAKTSAVALEYDAPVSAESLTPASYEVAGREISRVCTGKSADKCSAKEGGNFVIIELKTSVSLTPEFGPDLEKERNSAPDKAGKKAPPAGMKPGKGGPGIVAGGKPERKADPFPIEAEVRQALPVKAADGRTFDEGTRMKSTASKILIADDFRQLSYKDDETGVTLRYNLFIPRDYDSSKRYPLVLFMHDASGANQNDRYTLHQGNGAVVWASPESQSAHPAFVLAPQYDEIVVDDDFTATASAGATIGLLHHVEKEYSVDKDRVYTTGQSMGCMMSYLLLSTHPDEFAAGLLVAGQWDPKVIAPMAEKPLWLVSSTGDAKSSAGAETALRLWGDAGAKIARNELPFEASEKELGDGAERLLGEDASIRYTRLQGGWHNGTWRVAYGIRPIRDWLMRQHR